MDNPSRVLEKMWVELVNSGVANPRDRLVGYLLTGDPTYLAPHSRGIATGVWRDELIEVLVRAYFKSS